MSKLDRIGFFIGFALIGGFFEFFYLLDDVISYPFFQENIVARLIMIGFFVILACWLSYDIVDFLKKKPSITKQVCDEVKPDE